MKMNMYLKPLAVVIKHPFSRPIRIAGDMVGEHQLWAGQTVELVHHDYSSAIVRYQENNRYKYVQLTTAEYEWLTSE